jgi:hypothetical protein
MLKHPLSGHYAFGGKVGRERARVRVFDAV